MSVYCFWMFRQPLLEVVAASRDEAYAKAYHAIACAPTDNLLVLLWERPQ